MIKSCTDAAAQLLGSLSVEHSGGGEKWAFFRLPNKVKTLLGFTGD